MPHSRVPIVPLGTVINYLCRHLPTIPRTSLERSMEGEVVYLYAFDVGYEIITRGVQEILSEKPFPFEIRMDRTLPKDVPIYRPLAITLPPLEATLFGHAVRVQVRIYAAGVISLVMRAPFAVSALLELMPGHNPVLSSGRRLDEVATELCTSVYDSIAPYVVKGTTPNEPEAYTVFCIKSLENSPDLDKWLQQHRREVAALLSEAEPHRLSEAQLTEALRVQTSFENSDLVVVDWDAALVVDLSGYVDAVVYVLELANLQLEEFRVMDSQLDTHLNSAYADLERLPLRAFGHSRSILQKLRTLRVDFAELNDEVTHISKFFGDWYLARIYMGARDRFHIEEWRQSIEQRLAQLDQLYSVVHGEIHDRRMLWLEITIVVLFLIDIGALILFKR